MAYDPCDPAKPIATVSADPSAMLIDAMSFVAATRRLQAYDSVLLPLATNAWFALELLLKTIAQASNGQFLRTHCLNQLYADLPPEVQGRIGAEFRALVRSMRSDDEATEAIRRVLWDARNVFAQLRYLADTLQGGSAVLSFGDPMPLLHAVLPVMAEVARRAKLRKGKHKLIDFGDYKAEDPSGHQ